MADQVTLAGDLKVYNDEFQSGFMEGALRVMTLFNGASRNTITLKNLFQKGNYETQAFWKGINAISRRDNTTQATVDSIKLEQDETNKFKVYRRFGPVATSLTAFDDIGDQNGDKSFAIMMGKEYAEGKLIDMIDTTLVAVVGALSSNAMFINDQSTVGTAKTEEIYKTTAKFGDRSQTLNFMVMHSKPYHDLTLEQLQDYGSITSIGETILIHGGTAATYNKPVLVMDSPALVQVGAGPNGVDLFNSLILRANAAVCQDPGGDKFAGDLSLGKENLQYDVQGEYTFWVAVDNFRLNETTAGINPDNATLLTGANWTYTRSDDDVKAAPGLLYITQ